MSLAAEKPIESRTSAALFTLAALLVIGASAALSGWFPLTFSIVAVILFAGPHNWMELRYFLGRLPARWGSRRWFYTIGLGGTLLLSAMFILISVPWQWQTSTWTIVMSSWNTLFLLWVALLIWLRGQEKPGDDRFWVWPVACLLIAGAWAMPMWWDIVLVYLHPVIALCFLQREIRRRHPGWLPCYYAAGAFAVGMLGLLWWRLGDSPSLPGNDAMTQRIAWVAGSGVFETVSTRFLVAAHTYMEMLHYAAWVVAIPLLARNARSWKTDDAPLAKKSPGWRRVVRLLVFGGAAVVVVLWACFAVDPVLTRNVYFTFAIAHVLAEFTFLIGTV
ncbi:hypothetical protein [Lignipirellula cremea]|uniref:Uncharacterized protein n=1 Tax=Lignipirellula cremea TaxID=2528010 RepID=A0A518DU52_9BACT|nr:hypothetical protein [Lignipirellula cremea]QDU95370.1 hypothetical protein Pla8534_31850 [Lignipirellula cremea]